jgi:hypothetical protein
MDIIAAQNKTGKKNLKNYGPRIFEGIHEILKAVKTKQNRSV